MNYRTGAGLFALVCFCVAVYVTAVVMACLIVHVWLWAAVVGAADLLVIAIGLAATHEALSFKDLN